MGVALNGTNLWGEQPRMQPSGLRSPSGALETEVSPRDVVRCQQCLLIQFRTVSDHCRRCARPLPPQFPPTGIAANPAEPLPTPTSSLSSEFAEEPLERGERNRKIAIGRRVEVWRKQRGLTQGQLAKQLGIPRTYLSRIENNRLLPGPMMIPKMASALAIKISDLLPERADRSASVHPAEDPATAALLRQFVQLPPREMAAVLGKARRMASNVIPLPGSAGPRGSQQDREQRTKLAVGL